MVGSSLVFVVGLADVVGLLVELEGDLVVAEFVGDGTGTELDDVVLNVELGFTVDVWPRPV